MHKKKTDQELLARFYQADDDSALEVFVERNRQWALSKARRYYPEEAEDIVQISVLHLMDAQPIRGTVANPLGWWSTIIGAVAVDQLRKKYTRHEKEYSSVEFELAEWFAPGIEDCAIRDQLLERIHEAISQMDDCFKETLLKRYFEDLTYKQISHILRISPGTVASRLARGIARIRDSLIQRGVLDLANELDSNGETTVMSNKNNNLLTQHTKFVNKWNDLWLIAGGKGLGRFKAQLNDDGTVLTSWRLDFPLSENSYDPAHPESAPDLLWFENELTLEDACSFKWSRYRSAEGATGNALAMMLDKGLHYGEDQVLFLDEESQVRVQSNGSAPATVKSPNDHAVVPDILSPLYICQLGAEKGIERPINLLCFERLHSGRKWGILSTKGTYSGRKGLPTGLSHTFEIEMGSYTSRDISIWTDDEGRLIGHGDERENYIVAGDEATARKLLAQRADS